jgi:MFS family permease
MMKLSGTENRTMLFSLNYGLQTISGAVGSLFAGQLPAFFSVLLNVQAQSAAAYQAVLIVSIALGMTSLIPLWMMKEPPAIPPGDTVQASTVGPSPQTGESFSVPVSRKKLSSALISLTAKMTVPQILIGFGAAILIPYMNVFFKFRYSISDSELGILFSVSSLLIGIGSIMAPWLSTRVGGKVRAVVVTQFGSLIFLLMTGFAPFLWLSSLGYLLRSALMNMSAPLYSAFCMERTPEQHQGFVNSVLNLSWNLGWSIGPFISGIVQEYYGFTPLFIATSILYLMAIMVAWTFFKNTEKVRPLAAIIAQSP